MKLCTCNQCGGVYEDMNPQFGAKEYTDYQFIQPLIRIRGEVESDGDRFDEFWACPVCRDDGYLVDDINHNALQRIDSIIFNKVAGVDCSEDDSAWIKGWLRDTIIMLESNDIPRLNAIQELFPLEYGEWADESEKTI